MAVTSLTAAGHQPTAQPTAQLTAWTGARYLYRITEGEKVLSEEQITGHAFRPAWDVLQRELISAGFTQAEGAERLLA